MAAAQGGQSLQAQGGSSPRTHVQGCPLWLERRGLGLVKARKDKASFIHFFSNIPCYQLCDYRTSLKPCTSGS